MTESPEEDLKVFVTFPVAALKRISNEMPGVELIEVPDESPLPQGLEADVLLTPPWDMGNLAEILERGVDWVHTIGTGVDRFPFELLGQRTLTCARGASAIPIAEWILAMMLAYEKQLPEVWIDRFSGPWNLTTLGGLYGRSLGLVGLGGIGEAVARYAMLLGMKVRGVRRSGAACGVDGVEQLPDVGALLEISDHIVLALPLTAESRHIIDRERLARIPTGAGIHLVNISRGGLIDQDALREALEDGRIACASLDVADPEPLPDGHWLYAHPKVRLSPHVSWNMPGAFDWLLDTFIDNLRRRRDGRPLVGIVDVEKGY